MTPSVVLAIAGCVALLVGVFGGGITAKEVVLPKLSTATRIFSGLIGVALIAIALWFSNDIPALTDNVAPDPTTPAMPTSTGILPTSILSTQTPLTQVNPTNVLEPTKTVINNFNVTLVSAN
jgi:hypothetical protein